MESESYITTTSGPILIIGSNLPTPGYEIGTMYFDQSVGITYVLTGEKGWVSVERLKKWTELVETLTNL